MRIGVVGLSGRMSQAVIEAINNHPDCVLSGVLVRKKLGNNSIPIYENIQDLSKNSDAIIDFSAPSVSMDISKKLSNSKVVLVCGTTGFTEKEFEEFQESANSLSIIYSPNMSIGINLLQMLLKISSSKLTDNFDSAIIDIHHRHKKDSPSGTALMLANSIKEVSSKSPQISALRIGEVPGEHQVIFSSGGESITLSHQAFNRSIFADGAIRACLWGRGKKPGLYSMQDVLNV